VTTPSDDSLRYGEALIAEAELEPLPNPAPERPYLIELSYPEFTCLCPRSGYPDFATISIRYVPDRLIVELKSIKLYLNRFRNEHIFHEAVINRILDEFVAASQPRWAEVVGDFNVRGNLKCVITAEHQPGRRPPRGDRNLPGAPAGGQK
jgi:7-cyano-7-deazaguanine reductase